QHVTGPTQFISYATPGGEREIGVAPGMVADEMAAFNDAAHQRFLAVGVLAHEKECGVNAATGKYVEDVWRPRRVGAVVECKCEFSWPWRSNQGAAEDLRSGRPRPVDVACHQAECCQSAQSPVQFRRYH